MSDHFSIYCESIACVLSNLLNDLINNKITDEEFADTIKSYESICKAYLGSLTLLSLNTCCKEHALVYNNESSQLEYLIKILSSDYETVKSTLYKMYSSNNKDTVH